MLEDGDNTTLTKGDGSLHFGKDLIGTTAEGEVSLMMDSNFISRVKWAPSRSDNSAGPVVTLEALSEATSSWTVDATMPTYRQLYIANGNKEGKLADWINGTGGTYWLSTVMSTSLSDWVYTCGVMFNGFPLDSTQGVRPVITIPKNQLD